MALKTVEEVDREGVRIAVGLDSAYDLYLTRCSLIWSAPLMVDSFRRRF